MIKIVKNVGQHPELKGKYIMHANLKNVGDMYAKVSIKPIIGYVLAKIKFGV